MTQVASDAPAARCPVTGDADVVRHPTLQLSPGCRVRWQESKSALFKLIILLINPGTTTPAAERFKPTKTLPPNDGGSLTPLDLPLAPAPSPSTNNAQPAPPSPCSPQRCPKLTRALQRATPLLHPQPITGTPQPPETPGAEAPEA